MSTTSDYFVSYVSNFNRIRLIELIEHENQAARERSYKLTLVVNPSTGHHFGPPQHAANLKKAG